MMEMYKQQEKAKEDFWVYLYLKMIILKNY